MYLPVLCGVEPRFVCRFFEMAKSANISRCMVIEMVAASLCAQPVPQREGDNYVIVCSVSFSNLLQKDLKRKSQMVTMEEREHVMSGNYQQLLDEQKRLDQEKANEVRGHWNGGTICCHGNWHL